MSQENLSTRWHNFRPSKATWLWSCAGCIVATMLVGFTAGGWVTGGTADEMVSDAREEARAELAATLCVNRFAAAPGAQAELTALKEASSWERDDFIEEGGWAELSGTVAIVDGSLDLCADKLVAMETLPSPEGETAETAETAEVQTTDG